MTFPIAMCSFVLLLALAFLAKQRNAIKMPSECISLKVGGFVYTKLKLDIRLGIEKEGLS